MLLAGDVIEQDANHCYIGMFWSGLDVSENTWYLGGIFLNKYYTVFDMTHGP